MKKLLLLLVLAVLLTGCAIRDASPDSVDTSGPRRSAWDPNWSSGGWDKPTLENWDRLGGG